MSADAARLLFRAAALGVAVVTMWLVYRFHIVPGWAGFDQLQRAVAVVLVVVLLTCAVVGSFAALRAMRKLDDEGDR